MTTKIEWAEEVWTPVTGCTQISPGCANCYAKRMAQRLRGRYGYPADDPFRVTWHDDRLTQPYYMTTPSTIFVCSMGDLFHPDVPIGFIGSVFNAMDEASWHRFLVLTKRPDRALEVAKNWVPSPTHQGKSQTDPREPTAENTAGTGINRTHTLSEISHDRPTRRTSEDARGH